MDICRKYYIKGKKVGLTNLIDDDHRLNWQNWLDVEMQRNFNYVCRWHNLEEYKAFFCSPNRQPQRFVATIVRISDECPIGNISLAPEDHEPDMSITLYCGFRGVGFGSEAFQLAIEYIFKHFNLDFIVAGAYEHNTASIRMLENVGFKHDYAKDSMIKNAFSNDQIRHLAFRLNRNEWKT